MFNASTGGRDKITGGIMNGKVPLPEENATPIYWQISSRPKTYDIQYELLGYRSNNSFYMHC